MTHKWHSSRVAARATRTIALHWKLSDEEVAKLLGIAQSDVTQLYSAADPKLASMVRVHLANLVMIWQSLVSVFGPGPIAEEWVHRPNRDFGDRPPLEHMMSGRLEDLETVRKYLIRAIGE